MQRSAKEPDFTVRKLPAQRRSRETFEAVVTACAWLLPERGYVGTTTNHIAERAGVNISSLYEYFPGKDAIVAVVAERLVERVLDGLAAGALDVVSRQREDAVRRWIEHIYETVARERQLVAVFLYQVPYTNSLPSVQAVGERILDLSQQIREHAGGFVHPDFSNATLRLVVNLVTSTIMELVLASEGDPGGEGDRAELLDELILRLDGWIRTPA